MSHGNSDDLPLRAALISSARVKSRGGGVQTPDVDAGPETSWGVADVPDVSCGGYSVRTENTSCLIKSREG